MICLLVSLMFLTIVLTHEARYDNFKLYSLMPRTKDQLQTIIDLKRTGIPLDFWSEPHVVNHPVEIMVPPHKDVEFHEILHRINIEWSLKFDDVQRYINESNPQPLSEGQKFNWTQYNNLEEIYKWMQYLVRRYYPKVRLITIGHSFEGRPIKGIKVSFRKDNKAVFIEGGMHAREWISPATVTYILNDLLTTTTYEKKIIARSYDWYFVPSVNPDGYEYTFKSDRLWSKNRHVHGLCTGTDLNRNWDNLWNATSRGPCCIHYPGTQPFSEPETKSLSEYISNIADKIVVYLAMHSYGQLILIPDSIGNHTNNYEEQYEVGEKVVEKIQERYGTSYKVAKWGEVLHSSSGLSVDWVKATYNVPFTYTVALRDRSHMCFLLPSEQIIPVGEEIVDGLVTLMGEVRARGY